MSEISTKVIKEAIYKLCFEANIYLNKSVYSKILDNYQKVTDETVKNTLKLILQNAKIAYEKKRPLCQDTGQVIVFVEMGQEVVIKGELLEEAINSAVKKCYKENFFRKSVVKNAIFDRANTTTNTPAILHTKIVKGNELKLSVLIKGAGSENKSKLEMMLPTSSREEVIKRIGDLIIEVGVNSCPPMFIGIGIGGTSELACLMSKEAFIKEKFSKDETDFSKEILDYVLKNSPKEFPEAFVLDVKTKTSATHIACMPVAITINCHSDRYSSCIIKGNNISYKHEKPRFIDIKDSNEAKKVVFSDDIETIKSLKKGEEVLLSGEIYVARDMAHKRLNDMLEKGEELPIDLKDKIIFYAGPCPNKKGEVIGSVGPTTASRMDKFATKFYDMGLLATIGKGSRSKEVEQSIKRNNAKYFSVVGGVAALLSDCVIKNEIIAFEELGAEALYRLEVKNFPIKVEIN